MQIEKELAESSPEKDMLLTIGVFDGVHLGHKYLIAQLIEHTRQQNLPSGVVTFRQHPRAVLSPQTKLPYLTNLEERTRLLKNEGVDVVAALSFDQELARLSAEQFVGLLKKYLRMRGLIVGPDFALGHNREGSANTLGRLGQEMDFSVTVIPALKINGEVVSSTAIRDALTIGNMKRVTDLIGRFFSLQGPVTTGAGRGSGLGFPTANLDIAPKQALPAEGVYATWAYIDGQAYQSMTDIGRRPTFGDSERTVETYILNYQGNLYGCELKIDIVERLRSDKKFDSIEELKKQIAEDVKQGIAILNSRGRN
jgi:riboflavin kinase/FMN adenylyltransferase